MGKRNRAFGGTLRPAGRLLSRKWTRAPRFTSAKVGSYPSSLTTHTVILSLHQIVILSEMRLSASADNLMSRRIYVFLASSNLKAIFLFSPQRLHRLDSCRPSRRQQRCRQCAEP